LSNIYRDGIHELVPSIFLVLGANPNWDISLIKKKWKELVRECHPDKYLTRGLPSEAVVLANNRLLKINEAWEKKKKMKN
jgi:DnaJ like chaperone protein